MAVLQGQPEPPNGGRPALKAAPDLERLLNAQLGGLGRRVGRGAQGELEALLAELEEAAPHLSKTYLARHLR